MAIQIKQRETGSVWSSESDTPLVYNNLNPEVMNPKKAASTTTAASTTASVTPTKTVKTEDTEKKSTFLDKAKDVLSYFQRDDNTNFYQSAVYNAKNSEDGTWLGKDLNEWQSALDSEKERISDKKNLYDITGQVGMGIVDTLNNTKNLPQTIISGVHSLASKLTKDEDKAESEKEKAIKWADKAQEVGVWSDYMDMQVQNSRERLANDYNATEQFFGDLAYSAGQQVPSMVAGGVAGKAATALGAATKTAQTAQSVASLGTMYTNVYNNTYNSLYKEGKYDITDIATKANLDALVEVGTEILVGGTPGLGRGVLDTAEEKVLSKVSSNLVKKLDTKIANSVGASLVAAKATKFLVSDGATFLYNVLGEGVEEVVAEFLSPYVDRMTIDPNASDPTTKDYLLAFAGGAITSAFFNTASIAFDKMSKAGQVGVIDDNGNINIKDANTVTQEEADRVIDTANEYSYLMTQSQGNALLESAQEGLDIAGLDDVDVHSLTYDDLVRYSNLAKNANTPDEVEYDNSFESVFGAEETTDTVDTNQVAPDATTTQTETNATLETLTNKVLRETINALAEDGKIELPKGLNKMKKADLVALIQSAYAETETTDSAAEEVKQAEPTRVAYVNLDDVSLPYELDTADVYIYAIRSITDGINQAQATQLGNPELAGQTLLPMFYPTDTPRFTDRLTADEIKAWYNTSVKEAFEKQANYLARRNESNYADDQVRIYDDETGEFRNYANREEFVRYFYPKYKALTEGQVALSSQQWANLPPEELELAYKAFDDMIANQRKRQDAFLADMNKQLSRSNISARWMNDEEAKTRFVDTPSAYFPKYSKQVNQELYEQVLDGLRRGNEVDPDQLVALGVPENKSFRTADLINEAVGSEGVADIFEHYIKPTEENVILLNRNLVTTLDATKILVSNEMVRAIYEGSRRDIRSLAEASAQALKNKTSAEQALQDIVDEDEKKKAQAILTAKTKTAERTQEKYDQAKLTHAKAKKLIETAMEACGTSRDIIIKDITPKYANDNLSMEELAEAADASFISNLLTDPETLFKITAEGDTLLSGIIAYTSNAINMQDDSFLTRFEKSMVDALKKIQTGAVKVKNYRNAMLEQNEKDKNAPYNSPDKPTGKDYTRFRKNVLRNLYAYEVGKTGTLKKYFNEVGDQAEIYLKLTTKPTEAQSEWLKDNGFTFDTNIKLYVAPYSKSLWDATGAKGMTLEDLRANNNERAAATAETFKEATEGELSKADYDVDIYSEDNADVFTRKGEEISTTPSKFVVIPGRLNITDKIQVTWNDGQSGVFGADTYNDFYEGYRRYLEGKEENDIAKIEVVKPSGNSYTTVSTLYDAETSEAMPKPTARRTQSRYDYQGADEASKETKDYLERIKNDLKDKSKSIEERAELLSSTVKTIQLTPEELAEFKKIQNTKEFEAFYNSQSQVKEFIGAYETDTNTRTATETGQSAQGTQQSWFRLSDWGSPNVAEEVRATARPGTKGEEILEGFTENKVPAYMLSKDVMGKELFGGVVKSPAFTYNGRVYITEDVAERVNPKLHVAIIPHESNHYMGDAEYAPYIELVSDITANPENYFDMDSEEYNDLLEYITEHVGVDLDDVTEDNSLRFNDSDEAKAVVDEILSAIYGWTFVDPALIPSFYNMVKGSALNLGDLVDKLYEINDSFRARTEPTSEERRLMNPNAEPKIYGHKDFVINKDIFTRQSSDPNILTEEDYYAELARQWEDDIEEYGKLTTYRRNAEGKLEAVEHDIPRKVADDGSRVRQGTVGTMAYVADSEQLTEAAKRGILSGIMSITTQSNTKTAKAAYKYWEADKYQTADGRFNMTKAASEWLTSAEAGQVGTAEGLAQGFALLAKLKSASQTRDLTSTEFKLSTRLMASIDAVKGNFGQGLQFVKYQQYMTPDGRQYYIDSLVNAIKKDYSNRKGLLVKKAKEAIDDYQIPTVISEALRNAENTEALKKLDFDSLGLKGTYLDKMLATEDVGKRIEIIEDALVEDIARHIPATLESRVTAWRMLSMLGNVRTHMRNVISNMAMYGMKNIRDVADFAVEDVFAKSYGDTMVRNGSLVNRPNAQIKQLANQQYQLVKERLQAGGKLGFSTKIDRAAKSFGDNFVGNTLESLEKGNSNLLEKEDSLFLRLNFKQTFANYVAANAGRWGCTTDNVVAFLSTAETSQKAADALNEALAKAEIEAQRATYREANQLASSINALSKRSPLAKFLQEGLLPFTRTPMNILKQGYKYSPAALAIDSMFRLPIALSNGDVTVTGLNAKGEKVSSVSDYIQDYCGSLTGSAIFLVGVLLGGAGLFKAGGKDTDKEEYYDEMLGYQQYSITIGDYNMTLDWLTPTSMTLFAGVELANALDKIEAEDSSGETTEQINHFIQGLGNALLSTADPFMNLSLLQGINDALNTYQDDKISAFVTSAATNAVSQVVPTMAGQLARTIDTTRRTTYAPKDTDFIGGKKVEQFWKKLKNKIPGLSETNQPYIDQWGRTEERTDNVFVRATEQFVAPYYAKEINTIAADDIVAEIFAESKDSAVIPSSPPNNYAIDGKTYYLTDKEYTESQKTAGNIKAIGVESIGESDYFAMLDTDQQVSAVTTMYKYANELSKIDFAEGRGVSYDTTNTAAKYGVDEAQAAGLSVGDYFCIKSLLSGYTKNKDKTSAMRALGLSHKQQEVFLTHTN